MHCDFLPTERVGQYRCQRCGFLTLPTQFPPSKIHRACRLFDLSQQSPRTEDAGAGISRGLGDTVAKFIQRVSFGKLKPRKDCGCRRRQAWLNRTVPYRRDSGTLTHEQIGPNGERDGRPKSRVSVLLRFPHGLGDAVQLTTVLKHLRHLRPAWQIDVAGKRGAHTMYDGLLRRSLIDGQDAWNRDDYTIVRTLDWHEPDASYADSPSTKAEKCMRDVFGISPVPSLCRYEIQPSDDARWAAYEYLNEIAGPQPEDGRFPVVVIHYQGNSARRRKNISEGIIRQIVDRVSRAGYAPVILDWESPPRSGLIARQNGLSNGVHCPGVDHPLWGGAGCGDGATLAALIQLSALFIGIDSGPSHIAGATDTPTIVVWTGHHPIHYFGIADHVTHLVPAGHDELIRGDRGQGGAFFRGHYHHRTYQRLRGALPMLVEEKLQHAAHKAPASFPALVADGDLWVRRRHRNADMVIVRDVLHDDAYRLEQLPVTPRTVLDIGAHIGAFAVAARRRWRRAAITCVEANPDNLDCLRANVADSAEVVHAAATYEAGPLAIASTVFDGSDNTGGSYVIPKTTPASDQPSTAILDDRYRIDDRVVRAITLEQLMGQSRWETIDLLKLDCEGCEISLLENTTLLNRIGAIVGEYHDRRWFESMVANRLAGWSLRLIHDAQPGTFWLVNLTK